MAEEEGELDTRNKCLDPIPEDPAVQTESRKIEAACVKDPIAERNEGWQIETISLWVRGKGVLSSSLKTTGYERPTVRGGWHTTCEHLYLTPVSPKEPVQRTKSTA